MSVIDASVWISYLIWEDEHHQQTRAWFHHPERTPQPLAVPTLLFIEVAGAISRRTGRPATAHRLVASLVSTGALHAHPFDERRIGDYVSLAAELQLRAADVVYVNLAQDLGVPLITWDRQQRSRAAQRIVAVTPDEALQRGIW